MRQTERVLWTKGVLLTPQHFQLQDRFLEDSVGFKLGTVTFCPWGFVRLELNREALAAGNLALTEAAGLMPDGLPFEIPGSDAAPAPKPLEEFWHADRPTLDIYLAIPEQQPGGRNVSVTAQERGTRYIAEVVLRRDENTGLMEKPIQVARKNFRLLAEGENLDGSTSMAVARVRRASTGEFVLDPHFVPPLLDIAASGYMLSIARRLVEVLSAKSATLSGTRRQRNQGLADFGVSDVANFWLLYTVNSHLPRLRHLFETRRGHPAAFYGALLELGGSLTTFSTSIHPRDLPAYDHSTLGECFTRLDEQVRELLETVVSASHVALPLRETEPSVYATAIEQDRYLSAPALYLAVSAAVRADELMRNAPRLIKISSGSQIQRLIRQALPGVPIRPLTAPPSSLPVKLDYQYFALDKVGTDWDSIARERNLAVYVPSELPEPKLELIVMLPRDR
ncbi:MAG: type VI secretion system baseplate subunit TssK [Longimicrobiales bacterium]